MIKTKFPYQNLSNKNIKGESWRDVPGLEMYCKISSRGRFKRLPYTLNYIDGRVYHKPERIIKPVVKKLPNRFVKDEVSFLHVATTINKQRYNYSVARLVYHCFIEPFNMKDESVVILTKDRNGLNIKLSNLKIASHGEKQKRIFKLKRHEALAPGNEGRLKAKATLQKANNKQVTKYNLQGKKVKTYPSVTAASNDTGISHSHICNRARGTEFSAGGFVWRYGNKKSVDLSRLLEGIRLRRTRNKKAFGKKVTQYTMEGKRLAKYPTLGDASKATGVARSQISDVINQKGNRYSAGGFRWCEGYGKVKILH